jgi:hypothetical protein
MAPKLQKTISDMQIGEIGYTVPWALDCEHIVAHDLTLNLVIRGDYSVFKTPMGQTVHMKMQRNEDGIIIFGDTVRNYRFNFSGSPMMRAWSPIPVTWIENEGATED